MHLKVFEIDAEFWKFAFIGKLAQPHFTSNPKIILTSYTSFDLNSLVLPSWAWNSTTVFTLMNTIEWSLNEVSAVEQNRL
jgi:hypothetical protein